MKVLLHHHDAFLDGAERKQAKVTEVTASRARCVALLR